MNPSKSIHPDRLRSRRERLLRLLRKQDCPALLITHRPNVRYLTGFTGEDSYLLISRQASHLISDARFEDQIRDEVRGVTVEIRGVEQPLAAATADLIRQTRYSRVGLEAHAVSLELYRYLAAELSAVSWCPLSGIVESLREIKDAEELRLLRHAIGVAEQAMANLIHGWTSEQTERHLAAEIEYRIRQLGGEGCSFPPIVAVGPRGALPHAPPGAAHLGDSPAVLIDWGARYSGYVSDLTRVFCQGRPSSKLRKVHTTVLRAQQHAIRRIRPGATLRSIDQAARGVIEDAGYGNWFRHATGHGIGLEIHESPRLGPRQDRKLVAGMVVTVEPGIYLPGWGGVRIEDDVLVTRDGYRILSSFPRELDACTISRS